MRGKKDINKLSRKARKRKLQKLRVQPQNTYESTLRATFMTATNVYN